MLIITDSNPKINQWRTHKLENLRVLKHFRIAAIGNPMLRGRYERMRDCGNFIQYTVDPEGKYHYTGAWLCKDRLCPICSWRLSVKRTAEMVKVLNKLHEEKPRTHAIHVVLTIRNCTAEELRPVLCQLTEGFTRLKKRQLWNDYILGYARSVEVTYNKESDTYHPHIHVIAIVPNAYTRQISIGDWVDMWRDSIRVNYNPIVWANQTYYKGDKSINLEYDFDQKDTNNDAAKAAIIEACKYAVKPESIQSAAEAGDISTLATALNGLRLVSFGGILKKIRKDLKLSGSDKPNEQLPKTTIDPAEGINAYTLLYEWCSRTRSYIQTVPTNSDNRPNVL